MSEAEASRDIWQDLRHQARQLLELELSDEHLRRFASFTGLLLEWNRHTNLTGITAPAEIAIKHFLDSLSLLRAAPGLDGLRLIDVGTGAGFPGLVIAMLFPRAKVTLLDSTLKKLRFIEQASQELGMSNIRCLHARAEDAGRQRAHRQAYDIVTARAVAPMPALMEYTLPLAKLGGQVIAMRGQAAYAETSGAARAITTLGGELFEIEEIRLPGLANPRYLVVIDKIAPTPRRYPRSAGTPTRDPLR